MDFVHKKGLLSLEQLQRYGKMGAKVRSDQRIPVRKRAIKLAQEGRFATRHKAARGIAKAVVAYAASVGVKMSDYHAPVTIAGWLEEAGVTFPNDR
jgi:hypothetical protein